MSADSKTFFLKWKGEESGPFSVDELNTMLASGKIGLFHLVRCGDSQWKPIREIDLAAESEKIESVSDAAVKKRDKFTTLLCVFCGASFLSPWVWASTLALCVYAWTCGQRRLAVSAALVASFVGGTGVAFFYCAYPVLLD